MSEDVDRPVLLVVASDAAMGELLGEEVTKRYAADYQVRISAGPNEGLAELEDLRRADRRVALVLADHQMEGMSGVEFLSRVHAMHRSARRLLVITPGDRAAAEAIVDAFALGSIDYWTVQPISPTNEDFHLQLTESLLAWCRENEPAADYIQVIGEHWSSRGHEIRDVLTRNGVPFVFHDRESEPGRGALVAAGVREASLTLIFRDGRTLVDPELSEIAGAIGVATRPSNDLYDVAVIGAGPAGLSASVYAASEGLRTIVVEAEALGGQAGTSSLIRNYLGFPMGIGGSELAQRAYVQAWLFGVEFLFTNRTTSLEVAPDGVIVGLSDESRTTARSVILATGVSYRRLDAPSLEALVGAGVFYGAAGTEAQALRGEDLLVVGGGNSAGQAALHLADYAREVTIAVRSTSLASSMSDYLVDQIERASNVHVQFATQVVGGRGSSRLESVTLRDLETGEEHERKAAAIFVMIGAEPGTDWLPAAIERDRWGYILTGDRPVAEGSAWPLDRAPYRYETSLPGVFAVGDVRHGSVKRVASSVGEGSVCIRDVHDLLASSDERANQ